MASVNSIVAIKGLQSDKGKDLNGCFGKVACINENGRRGVLLFCRKVVRDGEVDGEVVLTPLVQSHVYALRAENLVPMEMTDKTSVHFRLYTTSLYMRLQATAALQGEDPRKYLESPSTVARRMICEELYNLEGNSMRPYAKMEYATLLRFGAEEQKSETWQQDLERALQLLTHVIRENDTTLPMAQLKYDCSVTLLDLGRVHSALDVARDIDTSGDSAYAVTIKLEVLDLIAEQLRKENDNCEEDALKKILEINKNEPFALWSLAAYYGRRDKAELSYNNYKKALEYGSAPKTVVRGSAPFQRRLSKKDRERITRDMQAVKLILDGHLEGKQIIAQNEKQTFLLDSGSLGNGRCSRQEEAGFDLLNEVD